MFRKVSFKLLTSDRGLPVATTVTMPQQRLEKVPARRTGASLLSPVKDNPQSDKRHNQAVRRKRRCSKEQLTVLNLEEITTAQ